MFRLVLLSLFFYTAYGATCSSDIYNYGSWDSSTNTFTVTSNIPSSGSPFSNCAIEGESAASVVFSNTVTSIGNDAFKNNGALTSVTIPDSVTSIGDYAFYGNSLTEVTIPDSVTSIDFYAFDNNPNIALIIGDALASVIIPTGFTSVTIVNVTSIGQGVFYGLGLTSVTIANSVTSIGLAAFYDNALTEVTIPDSVTSIESSAFGNNALTSVIIPDSVTSIARNAFDGNNNLIHFTVGVVPLRSMLGLVNESATVYVGGDSFLSDASCSELKSTYNTAECCV